MSLFGDDQFHGARRTLSCFGRATDRRPRRSSRGCREVTAGSTCATCEDAQGRLESLTLTSPDDFAAMDISYVTGEEVVEQVEELSRKLMRATLTAEEREKLCPHRQVRRAFRHLPLRTSACRPRGERGRIPGSGRSADRDGAAEPALQWRRFRSPIRLVHVAATAAAAGSSRVGTSLLTVGAQQCKPRRSNPERWSITRAHPC